MSTRLAHITHNRMQSLTPVLTKVAKAISAVITLSVCQVALAEQNTASESAQQTAKANSSQVEVITITAPSEQSVNPQDYAIGSSIEPDLATWLNAVPGASINRNGPITGIAQYRGLFGDRVSVGVDGHTLIGAGPNAMDTPLSYVTPLIVESMSLYRGITPVSAGVDTFAGSIDINMRKAQINDSPELEFNGQALVGYQQLNQAKTYAAWANINQENHGLMVFVNSQNADDYQDANGVDVTPTRFDKQQAGFDYRYQWQDNQIGVSFHDTDTKDSGTPALPMDIGFITGKRSNIDGTIALDNWTVSFVLGHLAAKHGMDNFSLRHNDNPAGFRHNYATADSTDFSLHFEQSAQAGSHWLLGLDGYVATHDATITNPNNAMFNVANFNNIEDNRIGAFVQWHGQGASQGLFEHSEFSTGLRIKHITSDSDQVSHHMAASNMMIAGLVSNFNNAERSTSDTLFDFAFNSQHQYNEQTKLYAGVGIKQQAPSYQQRYLWAPMEATGGLADGKTYVGQIDLNFETAYQLDLGINYHGDNFYLAPHIYYQQIDDYIHGIAATDPAVKMVANMMMGDQSPLVYANVDAKIYGIDLRWYYQFNQQWQVSGLANYVKGKRQDISDNLYRIAPLNGQIALSYRENHWFSQLSVNATAKQHRVSASNFEQQTAGYVLVDWSFNYDINDAITVRTGINNLFDKQYVNHLGGYNRAQASMNTDMDMGNDMNMGMNADTDAQTVPYSRVPGQGRNAFIELDVSF